MSSTTRRFIVAVTAVVALIGVIIGPRVVSSLTKPPAAPELATASHRSFPVVVTATGTLVPGSQVAVNFSVSGQLKELDAKVGDKVTVGQVIARVDDTVEQAGVAEARASLQSAQAALAGAQNPLDPAHQQTLMAAVASAQALVNATQASVDATSSQDSATVAADQQRVNNDQQRYAADGCAGSTPSQSTCSSDQAAINSDQSRLSQDQSREQQDAIAGQQRVAEAEAQLTQAQSNLRSGSVPNPNQVQAAQAQVAAAQAQLDRAQAADAKTVLTAPVAGAVLAINGQVGELVGNGSGTLPDSTAPLPADSAGSPGTGSTKAFVLLGDASTLQVAAPFAEGDAARLATGEGGTFSVDALSGVSIPCHLAGLAQGSTVTGGVVQYLATIAPDVTDQRLRPGMTVNVSINVAHADNVLSIPNQALYTLDNRLQVDVWFDGRAVPTAVEIGLVGDKLTEVKSGLMDGQQVVLSARHALATPTPGK